MPKAKGIKPTITEPRFASEDAAREFLEARRWPGGKADVVCPHCGVVGESYRLESHADSKAPVRKGVWKCGGCREQFTVTVGTIFEGSHIPLQKWLMAVDLLCASKKGMSACQLGRMLGVTYKSAWFMAHRLRYAMAQEPLSSKLQGIVEVDETYVGGKAIIGPYKPSESKPGPKRKKRPSPTENKAPVVSLVQRGGDVRSFYVANVTGANLKPVLKEMIAPEAHVMTDESKVYSKVKKDFAQHSTVNHTDKEYSRREGGVTITTNTVEGVFSIFKRGVYGTFHHLSRGHMHRYLAEFDFRYNSRKLTDRDRTILMLKGIEGKRLMYRDSSGKGH